MIQLSIYNDIELFSKIEGERKMSEAKKYVMTYEGIKKLEDELEYLKTVKRKEITEKIKVALGYGDLSENSEYDEAKNEQAFVEGRIIQLENMLRNASVVDESEIPKDMVSIGTSVKVFDYEFDEEIEFYVGNALMGKRTGDIIEVSTPDGINKYKVLEINR